VERGSGKPRGRLLLFVESPDVPVVVHFLSGRHFEGTDDAEAEELGVGVVPDGFGELGVLLFPCFAGGAAGGDAEVLGVIVP
jgi:hypothetical protein